MVDKHAHGMRIGRNDVAQFLEPRKHVHVGADDDVGCRDRTYDLVVIGLEDGHVLQAAYPVEEIGILVRHDTRDIMPARDKRLTQGKRRPYCIAVGIDVRQHDNVAAHVAAQEVAQCL